MNDTPSSDTAPDREAVRARVQDCFDRSGLLCHLGAHLGEVAPGRVHIHLPYGAQLTQHLGFFHAGATSAIADAAGGFAALTRTPIGYTVLTVEFKVNLMAPAQGESLEAVARVIRAGRTLSVVQVDVYAVQLGEKTPVALMQQTLMSIPEK